MILKKINIYLKTIKLSIQNYKILIGLIGFQLFRLMLFPFMGLMPQDAYYYLYGQNLSLSYFDHPGMIGYLLKNFYRTFWTLPFSL